MKRLKLMLPILLLIGMISVQSHAQDKEKAGDVYLNVEEMPEYPGGELALRKDIAHAIKYPDEAKKKGISGKVYVSFVVNEKGKITDSKIAKGIDLLLNKEALRVMNELKNFSPGKQNGKAVKVSYTTPILFDLENKSKEEK